MSFKKNQPLNWNIKINKNHPKPKEASKPTSITANKIYNFLFACHKIITRKTKENLHGKLSYISMHVINNTKKIFLIP